MFSLKCMNLTMCIPIPSKNCFLRKERLTCFFFVSFSPTYGFQRFLKIFGCLFLLSKLRIATRKTMTSSLRHDDVILIVMVRFSASEVNWTALLMIGLQIYRSRKLRNCLIRKENETKFFLNLEFTLFEFFIFFFYFFVSTKIAQCSCSSINNSLNLKKKKFKFFFKNLKNANNRSNFLFSECF